MKSNKKGLGKGLASLLGNNSIEGSDDNQIRHIDISNIRSNPYQPRKTFDEALLDELAQSIKANGIIQPVLVSKKGDDYYIIAGERRYLAARKAGLTKIPAIFKDYNEQQFMIISLIENLQRDDLTALDKAGSFKTIIEKLNLTHNELAQRLNIDRSNITNHLRLLKLPEMIKDSLNKGMISMGHCRALLSIDNERDMIEVFNITIKNKLSVQQLEKLVKTHRTDNRKTKPIKDPNMKQIEENLIDSLKTKVSIKNSKDGKGYIKINYYSSDDFDKIYKRLVNIGK